MGMMDLSSRLVTALLLLPVILAQSSTPPPPRCGGLITLTVLQPDATIETPYYSTDDPPGDVEFNCTWHVTVPAGKQVKVAYIDIDTVDAWVVVYDHPSSEEESYEVSRFLGDVSTHVPPFVSTVGGVTLFYSDPNSVDAGNRGFQIRVSLTDETRNGVVDPASCGGTFYLNDQFPSLTIGAPYNDNPVATTGVYTCHWRFMPPPGKEIQVEWRRLDLLNEDVGIIEDFEGVSGLYETTSLGAEIDFDIAPYVSSTGELTVFLRGRAASLVGEGFEAHVSISDPSFNPESCGGLITLSETQEDVSFTTPQFNSDTRSGIFACRWYIQAPDGQQVRAIFTKIDGVSSEEAFVYEGVTEEEDGNRLAHFYGSINETSVDSFGSALTVVYDDHGSSGRGFTASVAIQEEIPWHDDLEVNTCGKIIALDDSFPSLNFVSPTYPNTVDQFNYFGCSWYLSSPEGTRIIVDLVIQLDEYTVVNILGKEQFMFASFNDIEYSYFNRVQLDGNVGMVTFEAVEVPADVEQYGFFARVFYVPEQTASGTASRPLTECGGFLTLTQRLTSLQVRTPQYPLIRSGNYIYCTWVFTTDPNSTLSVEFIDYDLQGNGSLSVSEGQSPRHLLVEYAGPAQPTTQFSDYGVVTLTYVSGRATSGRGVNFFVSGEFEEPTSTPQSATSENEDTSSESNQGSNQGQRVVCEDTSMTVYLNKSLVGDELDTLHVHFADESCLAYDYSEEEVALTTRYDRCDTTVEASNTEITYYNTVKFVHLVKIPDTHITRDMVHYHLNVSCEFNRHQLVSRFYKPGSGSVHFSEISFGNFSLSFDRYTDESFDERPADELEEIPLNDRLFFAVNLTAASGLTLFLDNCWSTPSADPLDETQYDLIKDGCASDTTLEMYSDLGPSFRPFAFDAYLFVESHHAQVFIHCEALICHSDVEDSRCAQGCVTSDSGRRRRRSATNQRRGTSTPHIVSGGPLRFTDAEDKQAYGTAPLNRYGVMAVGALSGVLCFAAGLATILAITKTKRHSKY